VMGNFVPKTKQMMVGFLGLIAIGTIIGWSVKAIETKDALLVIVPVVTGFFTLLKGEQ